MPDNQIQNSVYSSLIDAIGELHYVNESINNDKGLLASFIRYLSQNEAEISKFGKVSRELSEYLDKYDFTTTFQFDSMQKKLEALHPLCLKLAKMGEEAKKLVVYPDRYNSKKAIENCRGLTMTCMERMSLSETGKVETIVEGNTQKLIDIQNLFVKDGNTLNQINAAIEADNVVLNKFSAYKTELKQYVSEFPHQGKDDLAIVKGRIAIAKQVDVVLVKAETSLKSVLQSFGNETIPEIVRYKEVINNVKTEMRYADADGYKQKLNEVAEGCVVLLPMNEMVKSEKGLLSIYQAYCDEIKNYVNGFPHSGQNNFAVIKERIDALKQIDSLRGNVERSVYVIKDYCDRYNKNAVVMKYAGVQHEMMSLMQYADLSKSEQQLNDVLKQANTVSKAFEKENAELKSFKASLATDSHLVWKEDKERLMATVTSLLSKDTKRTMFDLGQLKQDYVNAQIKRSNDIDTAVKQHPWLERRSKYRMVHKKFISQDVTSSEYHSKIKELCGKRTARIVLTCAPPVVGLFFRPEIK